MTLNEIVDNVIENSAYIRLPGEEDTEGRILITREGDPKSKVFVILGDNSSGKSFVCRIIQMRCFDEKIEPIMISMSKRTGDDYTPGVVRSLMFGSENRLNTGSISGHIITMAFKTANEREHPNVVILDEPDIGMSGSYHSAIGEYIAQQAKTLSKNTSGIIIVTHSRKIVESIDKNISTQYIKLGDFPKIKDWLKNGLPEKTVADFLKIKEKARELRDSIFTIQKKVEEENKPNLSL